MLTDTLQNKIIDYLKSKTKTDNWLINGAGIEANDSIVYRFSSENHEQDYALKLYHHEKSTKLNPHYSAIKRFAALLNNIHSRYRVPEPIALFAEENCFLMEWANGYSLKDTLWKHCFNKKQLQIHITDASLWLKHYHQSANLEMKQVDTSRYLKNLQKHIINSNAEDLLNDNEIFKLGFEALNSFEKSLDFIETYHADLHGDLNLANFIVGDNLITGIDIGGSEHLPIEDDIAQMLNYMCVNYFNMLTRFDIQKPQETWEIFNVVLDAYGYSSDPQKRRFFLFVFLYQMLYRWISIKKTHDLGKEKTMTFFFLGKWRLYNSAVIVKSLSSLINAQLSEAKK